MSEFDSAADMPFQLKIEGEKITVRWQPGVPTQSTPGVPNSAQGTISWNIPTPARGCATTADGTSAYCGALVVVSTTPLGVSEQPKNGMIYDADATVNPDLHAGDKIGNAMVVGMFLEGEKKANGLEMTTSLVVNDVDANTPYYVAVHAMDCQFRYHAQGSAAYSREFSMDGTADTPSVQIVSIGSGIKESDALPAPFCSTSGSPSVGQIFQFDLMVSNTFPNVQKHQIYPISVDASKVCTYSDLVFEIRKSLIVETLRRAGTIVNTTSWTNPSPYIPSSLMSPSVIEPPNTGQYSVVGGVLYQFNGSKYTQVTSGVYYELVDPTIVNVNDYWWNPELKQLKVNTGSPVTWTDVDVTIYSEDPIELKNCNDYWFDGTRAFKRCATTWCEQTLYTTNVDPSLAPTYDCCLFWYDSANGQLNQLNNTTGSWEQTYAIMWDVAPNAPIAGTYWLDDTSSPKELKQWGGSPAAWSPPITFIDSSEEPTGGALFAGGLWYNPDTEELKERDPTNTFWIDHDVILWSSDPTDVQSCDKWWKTGSPTGMFLWDSIHNTWNEVEFVISDVSPFTPPTIELDSLWYNPDTEEMMIWNGSTWEPITTINSITDPTLPVLGEAWYNPDTNSFYVWSAIGSPAINQWVEITPIDSTIDPILIPDGSLWYDTDNLILYRRDGGTWVEVEYVTNLNGPVKGSLWYDQSEGILKEWSGSAWVPSFQIPVDVFIDENGNLRFETIEKGSNNIVMIIVPSDVPYGQATIYGKGCTATYSELQMHSYAFYGGAKSCPTTIDQIQTVASNGSGTTADNFLFGENGLSIAKILPQVHGFDGIPSTPSSDQIGVGTDGTSDERKMLANFIRESLGYPVVEVELTQSQMNIAIRKALDVFRQKSSLAYNRGFFFMDVQPGVQQYTLTSKVAGYNKINNVMGIYRFTSAFLSSAHGSGVYGQVVLQHLYNMGTYDLTSYHLVAQYIEQLEHLFATRLTFHWDKMRRNLSMYTVFTRPERVLIEASVDRTEQELMVDPLSKNWIERWALAEARLMLAEIRGKYASLPGAGGGIALNAADLITRAEGDMEKLLQELEDFQAQDIEDYGMGTSFLIG